MAEKILNVRLINKHDTYANLQSSSFVPMAGEIILAEITAQRTDPHGNLRSVPTYCMKVGDGSKTFSQLEWLHAPASDVFNWAKAEGLTVDVTGTGNGLASIKWENDKLVLTKAQFAVEADITSAIAALKDAEIKNAANAAAAAQSTANTALANAATAHQLAEAAQDAADAAQVDVDALEEVVQANADAATAAISAAKTEAVNTASDDATTKANTAKSEAITAAAADATTKANNAEANAKAHADAEVAKVADDLSALETRVGVNETNINGLDGRLDTAEADITTIKGQITSLNAATCFQGAGTLAQRPASGKKEGAIYVATDNNKEYIWNGSAWVELGDTTAELQRISALETKAGSLENAVETAQEQADKGVADAATAQREVDALEGVVATLTQTVNSNKTAAETAVADEKTARENADTTIRSEFAAADASIRVDFAAADKEIDDKVLALTTRVTTAEGEIDAIQETLKSVATSGTVAQIQEDLDTAEDNINALETRVGTLETAATTKHLLIGNEKADKTFDLLVGSDTIIFNCGTASTNI